MDMDSNKSNLNFSELSQLNATQKSQIIALWNREYPTNIRLQSKEDFEKYLSNLQDQKHMIATNTKHIIIAWYVDFIRKNERWFAMIIDSNHQRQGIGSKLMQTAKSKNVILNGWVVDSDQYPKTNGEKYKSPLAFYSQHKFEILKSERLETKELSTVKIKWKTTKSNE